MEKMYKICTEKAKKFGVVAKTMFYIGVLLLMILILGIFGSRTIGYWIFVVAFSVSWTLSSIFGIMSTVNAYKAAKEVQKAIQTNQEISVKITHKYMLGVLDKIERMLKNPCNDNLTYMKEIRDHLMKCQEAGKFSFEDVFFTNDKIFSQFDETSLTRRQKVEIKAVSKLAHHAGTWEFRYTGCSPFKMTAILTSLLNQQGLPC